MSQSVLQTGGWQRQGPRPEPFSVLLSAELRQQLERAAEWEERSKGAIVRRALQRYLEVGVEGGRL